MLVAVSFFSLLRTQTIQVLLPHAYFCLSLSLKSHSVSVHQQILLTPYAKYLNNLTLFATFLAALLAHACIIAVVFQLLMFSQPVARGILHKSDSVPSLLSFQQVTPHLVQHVSKSEPFCLMRLLAIWDIVIFLFLLPIALSLIPLAVLVFLMFFILFFKYFIFILYSHLLHYKVPFVLFWVCAYRLHNVNFALLTNSKTFF